MQILSKLQELSLTQKDLAKKFNCRPQQISSAIHNGDQPTLMKKIIKYLNRLELNNERRKK